MRGCVCFSIVLIIFHVYQFRHFLNGKGVVLKMRSNLNVHYIFLMKYITIPTFVCVFVSVDYVHQVLKVNNKLERKRQKLNLTQNFIV